MSECKHEWTAELYPGPETRWCAFCGDTETEVELTSLHAEVKRLRGERAEYRKWLEGICAEFESTIAHAEWRAAGSKGMSVPFFGDFSDAARHPGMIGRMGWWARQFRAALKEGDR